MKCIFCSHTETKVVDSRESEDITRRRRECLKCEKRFTTYERPEPLQIYIIKKDGRREAFDREKLMSGILVACEKRPISVKRVERLVDDIERSLEKKHEKEIASNQIGELVMKGLHSIDEIAYVRFASVYRQFKDINQFMDELKDILGEKKVPRKALK